MGIGFEIDERAGVVRAVATGELLLSTIRDHLQRLLAEPRLPQPLRELFDGSEAVLRLSPTEIKIVVEMVRNTPQLQGGRVAVVTGDHDLLYGITRLTATTMELARMQFALRAFRGADEAARWVVEPAERSESA